MLAIQRHRFGPAANPEQVVDRVDVIHVVAVADHLPQVGRADADQAVVLLAAEDQAGKRQERVGRVEHVGVGRVPCPRVVADAVATNVLHLTGLGAVAAAVHAPGMARIERVGPGRGQRGQGVDAALRIARAGEQVDQGAQRVGDGIGTTFDAAAGRDHAAHHIGHLGTLVDPVDRGDRRHQVRAQRRRHPRGRRALAVADQVDLATTGRRPGHDLPRQLGATLLAVVERGDAGDIDPGTVTFEVPGDGVEIVDQTADGVEAGHAVHQHDRVPGPGVVARLGLDGAEQSEGGDGSGIDATHGCLLIVLVGTPGNCVRRLASLGRRADAAHRPDG